jgi:hypothetical protein
MKVNRWKEEIRDREQWKLVVVKGYSPTWKGKEI